MSYKLFCLFILVSITSAAEELYGPHHVYQIEDFLGQGRRSHVYRAFDETERIFALKKFNTKKEEKERGTPSILLERLFDDEGIATNAKRAYRNGRLFNHPNISKSYALILQNKRSWVVMDYVEGENISQVPYRSLKKVVTFDLALQFLNALTYITRLGFYHGDISQKNFMITPQLQLKVIDLDGMKRLNGKDSINISTLGNYFRRAQFLLWEILNRGDFTDDEQARLQKKLTKLARHPKFQNKLEDSIRPSSALDILLYFNALKNILLGQDLFAAEAIPSLPYWN